MMRVLHHQEDSDHRLLALLMYKMGIGEIELTHQDEMGMNWALENKTVTVTVTKRGSVLVKVMASADVPSDDAVIN